MEGIHASLNESQTEGLGEELNLTEYISSVLGHIKQTIYDIEKSKRGLISINEIFELAQDTKSELIEGKVVHVPRAGTGYI